MAVRSRLEIQLGMALYSNPVVRQFLRLKLVSRTLIEDGEGKFFVREVRKDEHGERLRYTYPLDTPKTGE